MSPEADHETAVRAVADSFGVDPSALLGSGGEAWVFELTDDRVLRVLRGEPQPEGAERRDELVRELAQGEAPFRLPVVLERGRSGGRQFSIERRLPGRSVLDQLADLDRPTRRRLIEAHLGAAAALGDLPLGPRPWFGDLIAEAPVRTDTWRDYLVAKAAHSLSRAPGFEAVDAAALAARLPETTEGSFVHLDAFAGNMLAQGGVVTAVIDIGETSIRGDRRLDPLSAAIYLCAPEITPVADELDRRVAHDWLRRAGLDRWYQPARRWLAAYWAWAADDVKLHAWCRRVLLG